MIRPLARRTRAAAAGAVVLVLVVVTGCGPGTTPRASGTVPRAFVGVEAPDLTTGDPASTAPTVRRIAALGAGTLRQPLEWSLVEPAPGVYDFSRFDALVAAAARHRVDVLPVLIGTPPWAMGAAAPPPRIAVPPADPATLGRFAQAMVARYGPRGDFWSAHRGLPRRPIRAWQVWNEPNLPQYWAGHPDPAGYVRMLRTVGRAIHRADPRAEVVSAGIPNSRLGIPFSTWVRRFFAAGGRGTFDAFGLHGYAASPDGVVAAVAQTRAMLRAYGAARAPIRVTEFGWADRGPLSAFTVSTRTQAFDVRTALTRLAAAHRVLGLEGVVYFTLRDGASRGEAHRGWGYFTGLLTRTGAPKPAFAAFAQAARRITR